MPSQKRINIATALNSKYVRYTYVMLVSLFENQPSDLDIHIYLLHNSLTEEEQFLLNDCVKSRGGTLHFLFINKNLFPQFLPTNNVWTAETYFRLLLIEMLPPEIDRMLYLDVDIIINSSLIELFFIDFEGSLLCACTDSAKIPMPAERAALFEEQFREGFTYFNAGVLLLNISGLREKYSFQFYMELAQKIYPQMWALDQDLLNYAHWKEVKILNPDRYNMYAKPAYNRGLHYDDISRDTLIVHFTGQKPWEGQFPHYDIEQLWWDYAQKTPFFIEFLSEFVYSSINNPLIFDTLSQLSAEKQTLSDELKKSVAICQRLLHTIEEISH